MAIHTISASNYGNRVLLRGRIGQGRWYGMTVCTVIGMDISYHLERIFYVPIMADMTDRAIAVGDEGTAMGGVRGRPWPVTVGTGGGISQVVILGHIDNRQRHRVAVAGGTIDHRADSAAVYRTGGYRPADMTGTDVGKAHTVMTGGTVTHDTGLGFLGRAVLIGRVVMLCVVSRITVEVTLATCTGSAERMVGGDADQGTVRSVTGHTAASLMYVTGNYKR